LDHLGITRVPSRRRLKMASGARRHKVRGSSSNVSGTIGARDKQPFLDLCVELIQLLGGDICGVVPRES
jgi:hypothetical protein